MRTCQIKVVNKIKTHILCSITFSENRAVYETMLKNMVEPKRPLKTIRWRIACWISKTICAQAHVCAHAPTPIQPSTHTHTNARACVRACMDARTNMHALTHVSAHTHKYVLLMAFHDNSGFVNAAQCYVTRTLPVLSVSEKSLEVWGSYADVIAVIWAVMLYSVVEVHKHFRRIWCISCQGRWSHIYLVDGGINFLWNICTLLPDYITSHTRRLLKRF